MSSSVDSSQAADSQNLSVPKVRRPDSLTVLQSNSDDNSSSNGAMNGSHSPSKEGGVSGTSTPVPTDAPSSAHAISSARKYIRSHQGKRMFPTVEYTNRLSHFDPESEHSDFRGFFVLFWIGLAIMVITTALRNIKSKGYPFYFTQRDLFLANIWELGLSDFTMVASTAINLLLHRLYVKGPSFFRWNKLGIWIQSAFQVVWLVYWVNYPFWRNFTWTAQVFLTLHLLSLFMKMHSWAFYNGHLSEVKRQLDSLDHIGSKPLKRLPLVRYPSSSLQIEEMKKKLGEPVSSSATGTIKIGELRDDLAKELTSPLGNVTYPQNLTIKNYIDYLCCPTLCYELEYPRISTFRPMELFYKTLAVFGCVFLLTFTSEQYVIPVLNDAEKALHLRQSTSEGALIFAETISRLLFPFMVIFLLVFLVIFEYVCGAFAEITCFGDRHFYADWWNSCDWLEFSREWNIPVHNFFRRHVYSASLGVVSKPIATLITFLISALAHELVMGCITKKLRGYGFVALMLQMPIVAVQRSKWFRARPLLNNVLFWCSMILGLSLMCALYVLM